MKEGDQETERLMLASICEPLMKVQKSHTHKNKPTRTKETESRTHVCVLKAADWANEGAPSCPQVAKRGSASKWTPEIRPVWD